MAVSQDEAFHIIETHAEGSQEEFGWEEAGTAAAAGDQEEDGCGLSAYAAVEHLASEGVRAHTDYMLCAETHGICSHDCKLILGA